MKFSSQKGVLTLAAILLIFTVGGLITAGGSVYTHVKEKQELKEVVKMIRDNAHNLKKNHASDPEAWAQAEAWEYMAKAIENHEDIIYSKKMLKEAATLGINLIPGNLPFKKGTREAIEMAKNLYDTDNALKEAWQDQPKKPSKEMVDFLKAISKGKISGSALEIMMMKARAQALNRQVDDIKEKLEADERWQQKQRDHLDNYRQLFIKNSIKSALEQLEKNGKLSSYYKGLFEEDRFKNQLGNYPQIASALKNIDEMDPVTEEEKEAIDETAMETIEEDEELTEALGEGILEDLGDWKKSVLETMAKAMDISGISEEEKAEEGEDGKKKSYKEKVKECKETRDRIVAQKQRKQKEDERCTNSCPSVMIEGSINLPGIRCHSRCMEKWDSTAGIEEAMAGFDYEMCVEEAKKLRLFGR